MATVTKMGKAPEPPQHEPASDSAMNSLVLQNLARGDFQKETITQALLLKRKAQEDLFQLAQKKRDEYFPSKKVEIRTVIEMSNICRQNCDFCNISSYSNERKYILGYEEFLKIVAYLYRHKRRVLLLQSGENRAQSYIDHVSRCISAVKTKYPDMEIILCLGNLSNRQYGQLREAGGDRYLLKFETSNAVLYRRLKPLDTLEERLECLSALHALGFDLSSGNIIGLPSQNLEDIVEDLYLLGRLPLKMASTSVFIPGEESHCRSEPTGNLDIALNYMALMRLMYSHFLIPSTSFLEKARKGGQCQGLMAGANTVTIHDGTPEEYKKYFPIYSVKRITPNDKHLRRIATRANLIFDR